MVSFDANTLSILLFKGSAVPLDFRAKPPAPITYARERMERLVKELSQKGEKVLIPAPSLSEFLVTAVFAGASIQDYLKIIQSAQYLMTKPFGVRAAVEAAERLATAIKAGDKREGEKAEPWQKLKYDRQIVAISLVEGAAAIYSTDRDIHNQAKRWGILPVHPADLPIPAKQLPLSIAQPARQSGKPSEPPKTEPPKTEPPKKR
jgi:predicted nucleic acid-binding protein